MPSERLKYLFRSWQNKTLTVDALDANGFASLIFADAPDVASKVAPRLPIPFEGAPSVSSPVIRKNQALELRTVKIFKVNRMYSAGDLRHIFPSKETNCMSLSA